MLLQLLVLVVNPEANRNGIHSCTTTFVLGVLILAKFLRQHPKFQRKKIFFLQFSVIHFCGAVLWLTETILFQFCVFLCLAS